MIKKEINDLITQSFDKTNYKRLLKEIFNFEINKEELVIPETYKSNINGAEKLGEYSKNRENIQFFIVHSNRNIEKAKVFHRDFIAKELIQDHKENALVVFYNKEKWRFSLITINYGEKDGKFTKEKGTAQRASFLVGENEINNTCSQKIADLKENPSIEEVKEAFNVEKVTKEFFKEYRKLFKELGEKMESLYKTDKKIKLEFDEKDVDYVEFAKKTLGQIVFLYFLQKKEWLGVNKNEKYGSGQKDFLTKLFHNQECSDFFNDVLEPLFYNGFNKDRTNKKDYYSALDLRIPFLNGGLFEPLGNYNWEKTDILLGKNIFKNIFKTFNEFNFTISEHEPSEREVAVDPEMLGKIFEQLGAINKENFTEWKNAINSGKKSEEMKFNKSNGVYYTPREIVNYMCQQSLINYIDTNTEEKITKKDIEKFVLLGDEAQKIIEEEERHIEERGRFKTINQENSIPTSIKKNYTLIDDLLWNVKICDPAVGSGAFPMGILQEIVRLRRILSVFYTSSEKEKRTPYELKKETIENCIYGVDIDPSAIEIAKLRFWLSLVVDEKFEEDKIRPLPNLDFKLMQGNSLLEEFEGIKLFDKILLEHREKGISGIEKIENKIKEVKNQIIEASKNNIEKDKQIKELRKLERKKQTLSKKGGGSNLTLFMKNSEIKKTILKSLQKRLFDENDASEKDKIKHRIDKAIWEFIETTLKEENRQEDLEKIKKEWAKRKRNFFLWELNFMDVFDRKNPGFDIVIANPPYIQLQKNEGEHTKLYKNNNFDSFDKTGDIYCLFYEFGVNLLRINGVLSFITSNKWMRLNYGNKLRNFFITKTNPILLMDLGSGIFDTAIVDTNILFLEKNDNKNHIFGCSLANHSLANNSIPDYIENNKVKLETPLNTSWKILPKRDQMLILKIRHNKIQLSERDIKMHRGILTGYNDAFVINHDIKKSLIKKDPKSREIIVPLLRGRDVSKYLRGIFNSYLINTHNGVRRGSARINIEKYPAIKKHLDKFYDKLKKRQDKGDTPYNLRSCAYLSEFEKFKIAFPVINRKWKFVIVDKDVQILAPMRFITTSNLNELKFIQTILKSNVIKYYHKINGPMQDETGYQMDNWFVESYPFPNINSVLPKHFIEKVDKILNLTNDKKYFEDQEKQKKVKEIEKEINQMVYKLYGLTPEEIKIVEEFEK